MVSPAGPQFLQIIDTTGPQVGATVEYYSLADAPQAVYSDPDLNTPLGATLSGGNASDSKGRFPIHWLDPDLSYKRIIKLSNGSTWRTDNPIQSADTSLATTLADYVAKAGSTMTGPLNWTEGAAIASASSVNFDTSTGNFFHITGTTGISTITLTHGARWVVFDSALTLTHSSNLLIGGKNFTTHAGMILVFFGEGSGVTRLVGGMTATGRAIAETVAVTIGIGDQTTPITTGSNKRRWRAPFAFTVTAVRASLATAQASGANLVTVNISNGGLALLSTQITIDNNQTTSTIASTQPVLDNVTVDDDGLIAVSITNCDGSTTAAGLDVTLIGYRLNLA